MSAIPFGFWPQTVDDQLNLLDTFKRKKKSYINQLKRILKIAITITSKKFIIYNNFLLINNVKKNYTYILSPYSNKQYIYIYINNI